MPLGYSVTPVETVWVHESLAQMDDSMQDYVKAYHKQCIRDVHHIYKKKVWIQNRQYKILGGDEKICFRILASFFGKFNLLSSEMRANLWMIYWED